MAAVPSVTYSCHWGIFISLSFFSFFFFLFFLPHFYEVTQQNATHPLPSLFFSTFLFFSFLFIIRVSHDIYPRLLLPTASAGSRGLGEDRRNKTKSDESRDKVPESRLTRSFASCSAPHRVKSPKKCLIC